MDKDKELARLRALDTEQKARESWNPHWQRLMSMCF